MHDDSIMYFGKHEGVKLKNIPDRYFMYLYHKANIRENSKDLALTMYIENHFDVWKRKRYKDLPQQKE